ncbi:hypothetical protein ACIHAR_21120 [Streptomyces sp. NPDC052016]
MTTVHPDVEEMGRRTVRLLFDRNRAGALRGPADPADATRSA